MKNLLIVIVILIIVGLGYYFWSGDKTVVSVDNGAVSGEIMTPPALPE